LKIVGTEEYRDRGRLVVLTLDNCAMKQNVSADIPTNYSFLRTLPYLTAKMNISLLNFNVNNISIEGTGLIEINYEPDVFATLNHLNMINCSFSNISSFIPGRLL
jgi:hypothetical protein